MQEEKARSVRIAKNFEIRVKNAARGRRARAAFSRSRSQFFSLNGPTSRAITNISLGSEIRKQGRVTSPLSYSFILAKNVKK